MLPPAPFITDIHNLSQGIRARLARTKVSVGERRVGTKTSTRGFNNGSNDR